MECTMTVKVTCRLYTLRAKMCTLLESNFSMWLFDFNNKQQLARATEPNRKEKLSRQQDAPKQIKSTLLHNDKEATKWVYTPSSRRSYLFSCVNAKQRCSFSCLFILLFSSWNQRMNTVIMVTVTPGFASGAFIIDLCTSGGVAVCATTIEPLLTPGNLMQTYAWIR